LEHGWVLKRGVDIHHRTFTTGATSHMPDSHDLQLFAQTLSDDPVHQANSTTIQGHAFIRIQSIALELHKWKIPIKGLRKGMLRCCTYPSAQIVGPMSSKKVVSRIHLVSEKCDRYTEKTW